MLQRAIINTNYIRGDSNMAIKHMKSERINVRATEQAVNTLKELSKKLDLSQSEVVELALNELLKNQKE